MTEQEQAASVRVSVAGPSDWLAEFQRTQIAFQKDIEARFIPLAAHVETINRELGEVVGELRTLKWMLGGGFVAALLLRLLT